MKPGNNFVNRMLKSCALGLPPLRYYADYVPRQAFAFTCSHLQRLVGSTSS
jgi:hypothetical protein